MTPKLSLRERILAALAANDGDIDKTTHALLEGMTKAQILADFWPYFRESVRIEARRTTRTVEQRVQSDLEAGEDPVAARRRLASEWFSPAPGEPLVAWLAASADQHMRRAEWLRADAEDLERTAARHESAAADIRAAGASCLADLGVEVAA